MLMAISLVIKLLIWSIVGLLLQAVAFVQILALSMTCPLYVCWIHSAKQNQWAMQRRIMTNWTSGSREQTLELAVFLGDRKKHIFLSPGYITLTVWGIKFWWFCASDFDQHCYCGHVGVYGIRHIFHTFASFFWFFSIART